jgi:hypothetical protein
MFYFIFTKEEIYNKLNLLNVTLKINSLKEIM